MGVFPPCHYFYSLLSYCLAAITSRVLGQSYPLTPAMHQDGYIYFQFSLYLLSLTINFTTNELRVSFFFWAYFSK